MEQQTNKPTDLESEDLKGAVRELRFTCFKAHRDGSGKILRGVSGSLTYAEKNYLQYFDEQGIKRVHITFENNTPTYIAHYNEKRQHYKFSKIDKEGNITVNHTYEFDEKGRTLKQLKYNIDGSHGSTCIWEYDDALHITKNIEFNAAGNLIKTNTIIYDANYHQLEAKHETTYGAYFRWTKYINDDHGHVIENRELDRDGNIIKTSYFTNKYDSHGKIISPNSHRKPDNEIFTYTYEYDHRDNWIRKIEFYNNVPLHIYCREISYYGDDDSNDFVLGNGLEEPVIRNPKATREPFKPESEPMQPSPTYPMEGLNETQLRVLANIYSMDDFNMQKYYLMVNNEAPLRRIYGKGNVDAIALLKELKTNLGATVIHDYYHDHRYHIRPVRYTLTFPIKGYMVNAMQIFTSDEKEFIVPRFILFYYEDWNWTVCTSQFEVLMPRPESGKRDIYFERMLSDCFAKCTLQKPPELPTINLIEINDGKYSLYERAIKNDFEIKDTDLHYGRGFHKFHEQLMYRFQRETKGLILLHGEPGTGKTFYIRHLLRKFSGHKKTVIYMPPSLVEWLTHPDFITFLTKEITEMSKRRVFCVLLIEDAEPLLVSRQPEARVQGITNLLNMTDGLLNDVLKIQIICTFNVKLKELDKALMRPGRLIARKEFRNMSTLNANLLAQKIGVNHHFSKPVPIAEVYGLLKDQQTLLHGVGERNEE